MTGQKIDHGEKRRELEVVDRCEYKRYSLSTPAYSLSHDGERQAPAEADVSLGKENEFWITNGDRFPGLLWSILWPAAWHLVKKQEMFVESLALLLMLPDLFL